MRATKKHQKKFWKNVFFSWNELVFLGMFSLSPCFFGNQQKSNARAEKNMYARPKSNARVYLEQRKKRSGLMQSNPQTTQGPATKTNDVHTMLTWCGLASQTVAQP